MHYMYKKKIYSYSAQNKSENNRKFRFGGFRQNQVHDIMGHKRFAETIFPLKYRRVSGKLFILRDNSAESSRLVY